jgi:ABC-type glycerol-3-phosphate transport system permease component
VKILGRSAAYLALALAATLSLIPFVWLLLATLRPSDQVFSSNPFAITKPSLENYTQLFQVDNPSFLRSLFNSLFLACAGVMLQLLFCSLAGFALAKYEFKGKKALMAIQLLTLFIPGAVTLGPGYQLMYQLGLVNSYFGMLVGAAGNVFGIFLFRQAMLGVPDELLNAARIDGATEFGIYWNVVLPIVRPMTGAFCLLTFMGSWNSLLWPSMMLQTSDKHTLPIALANMVGIYSNQYGMLMAGTLLSVLPVVVLFLLLQKEFLSGLASGAVKG